MKTFKYNQTYKLESGSELPGFILAYHTYGKLNEAKNNVIWITHALTANSDVADWWSGLIGSEKLFDPDKHFIVCANILGSHYGSTGPLSVNENTGSVFYHLFPEITIRDIVGSLDLLREHLGINEIHTLLGGSLGGQQAMEWAISKPLVIKNLVLIATNAFHSPWGIAFNEAQRMAIVSDRTFFGQSPDGGAKGLKAARAIALLSYRNYQTYAETQKEDTGANIGNYKASSYQQYQGEKLVNRFNAYSYVTLSKTMDSHNVGRGRKSVERALESIRCHTLVIGISSDVLFPVSEQKFLANHIPNAFYKEIESFYGHDGFLIETAKLTDAIRKFYILKEEPFFLDEVRY